MRLGDVMNSCIHALHWLVEICAALPFIPFCWVIYITCTGHVAGFCVLQESGTHHQLQCPPVAKVVLGINFKREGR